jgi:hypothetical protein
MNSIDECRSVLSEWARDDTKTLTISVTIKYSLTEHTSGSRQDNWVIQVARFHASRCEEICIQIRIAVDERIPEFLLDLSQCAYLNTNEPLEVIGGNSRHDL